MKQLLREGLATFLTVMLIIGLLPNPSDASRRMALQLPVELGPQAAPSLPSPVRLLQSPEVKTEPAPGVPLSAMMIPIPQQSSARKTSDAPVFQALPGQTRTLLPDGRWLITGGQDANGVGDSAWLLDSSGIPAKLSRGLLNARAWHTATTLPDGT